MSLSFFLCTFLSKSVPCLFAGCFSYFCVNFLFAVPCESFLIFCVPFLFYYAIFTINFNNFTSWEKERQKVKEFKSFIEMKTKLVDFILYNKRYLIKIKRKFRYEVYLYNLSGNFLVNNSINWIL